MSALAPAATSPYYKLVVHPLPPPPSDKQLPASNKLEDKQKERAYNEECVKLIKLKERTYYEECVKLIQSGYIREVFLRGLHGDDAQYRIVEAALISKSVKTIDYSHISTNPSEKSKQPAFAEGAMVILCGSLIDRNCHITRLDLSGIQIQDYDACRLVKTLYQNHSLTDLNVSNCDYPGGSLQSMFRALEINERSNLTFLNISKNRLRIPELGNMTRCLMSQTKLKRLNLSECQLFPGHMETLREGLRRGGLTVINLDGNRDIGCGLKGVGTAIAANPYLGKISLRDCNFSSNDITAFALEFINTEIMMRPKYSELPELSILFDNNSFTHLAADNLSHMLNHTGRKIRLSLQSCQIDWESMQHLCKPITEQASLVVLDISKNPITERGAKMLYVALTVNRSLREVIFRECGLINGRSFEMLMINGHPTLKRLAW